MGAFRSQSRGVNLPFYILLAATTILALSTQVYPSVVNNTVMIVLTNQLLESDQYRQTDRSLINVISSDYLVRLSSRSGIFGSFLRYIIAEPGGSWAVGRIALASGEAAVAQKELYPLINEAAHNPFLYLDRLQSLNPQEAIEFYSSIPPPAPLEPISDTMALAYATTSIGQSLQKAREFRADDLAINYALLVQGVEDSADYDSYAEAVQNVTQSALDATHPQLLRSTARLVPTLYKDGLWDFTITRNVAQYLVWQYYFLDDVQLMLTRLSRQDPKEDEWRLLLGELAERNHRYIDAADTYRQQLATDSNSWKAVIGLARSLLAQEPQQVQQEELLHVTRLLTSQYTGDMPNDVVVLELLTRLYDRQQSPMAVKTQAALEALTDTEFFLSTWASSTRHNVRVGPNLVQNAELGSRVGNNLAGFEFWSYNGPTGLAGAFAAGVDSLYPQAARILNLRDRGNSDVVRPYGEYVSQDMTLNVGSYLVTVNYCTTDFASGSSLAYLGQNSLPEGVVLLHSELPSDDDGCHLYRVIVESSLVTDGVRLVLRNWGDGDFRILGVGVQEILSSP